MNQLKASKQITVLFITHYPAMYGANQSLCALILELREHHRIIPIVLLRCRGPITDFFDKQGIMYYTSHFYWWINNDKGIVKKLLNLRKQALNSTRLSRIVNLISKEKIDLQFIQ